ncbi:MAG: hypothetical protein ABR511_14430 [Acidimicrobiales bacterium]
MAVVAVAGVALVACSSSSKTSTSSPTTAAGAGATTTTTAAATVAVATNAQFGSILTDPASGKTLYTRDTDPAGASSCTGGCASTWPPLVMAAGGSGPQAPNGVSGALTTAARPDDATKLQVLLNGKALYAYAGDSAAGDTKGDGVGGIWHVAKAS